jgi:hypothetical protein
LETEGEQNSAVKEKLEKFLHFVLLQDDCTIAQVILTVSSTLSITSPDFRCGDERPICSGNADPQIAEAVRMVAREARRTMRAALDVHRASRER